MFSLLAQLRCNQNDMIDYRSSVVVGFSLKIGKK